MRVQLYYTGNRQINKHEQLSNYIAKILSELEMLRFLISSFIIAK